jgi:superfamily II DNA or RNA helicase
MAYALVARHATPVLVLVDRAPLLRQWQERLRTHLGLPAEQIGQISGGKAGVPGSSTWPCCRPWPATMTRRPCWTATAW